MNSNDSQFMGTEPLGSLFRKITIPVIVGLLISGLYNIVDTIFVGHQVGALAIGALSIAFPIQMLIYSVGTMLGTGSASIISRYLGAGKLKEANKIAGNALVLSILLGVLISVVCLNLMDPLLKGLGVTSALYDYTYAYLYYIIFGSAVVTFTLTATDLLRSEGKMKFMTTCIVIGAVLNIILDAILIFGLDMGIEGASLATVISQGVAGIYAITRYTAGKTVVKLTAGTFKPNGKNMGEILSLGLPVLMTEGGVSLLVLTFNNMITNYGGADVDLLLSVYGVVVKVFVFVVMPLIGIMVGFQPIAGYNYGAQKMDRVVGILKIALKTSLIYCMFFYVLMMIFPSAFFSIFSSSATLNETGAPILRTIMALFPTFSLLFVGPVFFQAIGKVLPSLFLSTMRVYFLMIPLLLILPRFLGIQGVWISLPIADGVTAITVGISLIIGVKKVKAEGGNQGSILKQLDASN